MTSQREGRHGDEPQGRRLRDLIFTRENLYALLLCLLVLALLVVTTDASPTWIYQGF